MSEDDDLPRLLSGRYRLEGTLGHGGMGVVYRGVDLMMKRPIAVKLIRAIDGVELDDEVAGRFMREAKNTARVQHQHIIEVFDLGRTDEGGLYFVMELLDGESLSTRLRRDVTLPPQQTVHIARQICDALHVAHAAGVIHRDLKPANIMLLSRAGDDNYVKVLDFGVAKSYSPDQQTQLTHTGMLVGTVDYMAPEQIMGKPVDGRTDIYSLGIMIYKMLCGKAPFRDTGVPALIHAHLNLMPKPLIEVAPGVPNDLDRVVLRCLAKNADRRYESMAELSRALADAVPPIEPVAPAHPSKQPRPTIHDRDRDRYDTDEKTTVARASDPPPPRVSDPPMIIDMPDADDADGFDAATLKMDRRLGFKKPSATRNALPMTPRGASGPFSGPFNTERPSQAPQAPQAPHAQRPSQAPRRAPDDFASAARYEPRPCAMCQTVNAPHSITCLACGVSLDPSEQDALRAGVRAVRAPSAAPAYRPPTGPPPHYDMLPRNQNPTGPHQPVPGSGPYDPIPRGNHNTTGPQMPLPRVQSNTGPYMPQQPWGDPHRAPGPPPEPSMWHRFLTWTGIRSR